MNIIYENKRKSETYFPHELNTRYYAVLSYRNGNSSSCVCRKYHISKSSLSKWKIKFDGTKDSLKDKSHRPITPLDKNYYQHTCIDEDSRQRFIYHYEEHKPAATIDFVYRCFLFYKYEPEELQTDNGAELTWNQEKMKVINHLQKLCIKEYIYHHKIKPRTPRHNGKVERSHRNDNERF